MRVELRVGVELHNVAKVGINHFAAQPLTKESRVGSVHDFGALVLALLIFLVGGFRFGVAGSERKFQSFGPLLQLPAVVGWVRGLFAFFKENFVGSRTGGNDAI